MGKMRKHSPHVRWSDAEVETLFARYPTATREELLSALPGRGIRVIQCKANGLGLSRLRAPARTPDEVRASKRQGMADRRAADIGAARAYARDYHSRNRDKQLAKMKDYQRRRFFWLRATKLKSSVDAASLAKLWKDQRGLCALTGRRLNRQNAQLDHIVAKARGGSDEIENLRWLCAEANLARRELSDAEFAALCSDVIHWIGQRIALVDALPESEAA